MTDDDGKKNPFVMGDLGDSCDLQSKVSFHRFYGCLIAGTLVDIAAAHIF